MKMSYKSRILTVTKRHPKDRFRVRQRCFYRKKVMTHIQKIGDTIVVPINVT